MRRLLIKEILKPNTQVRISKVDFNKELELKSLFDKTRKEQERLLELRDLPFENSLITI